MDTPSAIPQVAPTALPPSPHTKLYVVIAGLLVVIAVGALWVFWPHSAVAPEPSPSATVSPSPTPPVTGAGPGEHCGGNIAGALQCQAGYHCAATSGSHLPVGDVGGVCTADVTYRDANYGILVTLPDDWKDYTVSTKQNQAVDVASGNPAASFPELIIRHPLWTQAKPYEDLPIMIFTAEQWKHVGQQGENEWSVSAAPIPPSALASNSAYVLALPARYNFDYSQGFQELDDAIRAGAVSSFEPVK